MYVCTRERNHTSVTSVEDSLPRVVSLRVMHARILVKSLMNVLYVIGSLHRKHNYGLTIVHTLVKGHMNVTFVVKGLPCLAF
jgi:hypothetical protein